MKLDERAGEIGNGTASPLDGAADLLARFVARRDEAAFAALVARHGPMVLATCRRLLPAGDDADDAFQATFLVLARRAGSVRAERLAPWLHGVARRVAGRARAVAARRRGREGGDLPDVADPPPGAGPDLRAVIDEELARLPEKYRAPLVLCYLDGLTHLEAADQLGWPVGSVRSRLARGRDRLRGGLSRRGLAPGLLAPSSPATLPTAAVSPSLRAATTRLALLPPGRAARLAAGLLAQRTLTAMLIQQLGTATLVVAAGLAAAGALAATRPGAAAPPPSAGPAPAAAIGRPPDDPAPPADPALVSKDWDVADFTTLVIGSSFRAEIARGDRFAVQTSAGAPVAGRVEVRRDGKTLSVGLAQAAQPARTVQDDPPLVVRITLPRLEAITLASAARARLVNELDSDRLDIRLDGAARLDGTVRAKYLAVGVAGASRLALRGGADGADLRIAGASRLELADMVLKAAHVGIAGQGSADLNIRSQTPVLVGLSGAAQLVGSIEASDLQAGAAGASRIGIRGKVDRLSLDASGSSRAELGKLASADAHVILSGSSRAAVLASRTLAYDLSGTSSLESLGNPTEQSRNVAPGAKIHRVP